MELSQPSVKKFIEFQISGEKIYAALILVLVLSVFGVIIFISSNGAGSNESLASPSPSGLTKFPIVGSEKVKGAATESLPFGPNLPSKSPTPSPTITPSPTPSPTATPVAASPTPSPSQSSSQSSNQNTSSTPTPTPTPTAEPTDTPTPAPSPTASPSDSPTPSPTVTPSPSSTSQAVSSPGVGAQITNTTRKIERIE